MCRNSARPFTFWGEYRPEGGEGGFFFGGVPPGGRGGGYLCGGGFSVKPPPSTAFGLGHLPQKGRKRRAVLCVLFLPLFLPRFSPSWGEYRPKGGEGA